MSKPYRTSDFLARRADAAQKAAKDAARAERLARARADIELDLPRFSREALGHSATVFSNCAGLVKSRAEWRRTGL